MQWFQVVEFGGVVFLCGQWLKLKFELLGLKVEVNSLRKEVAFLELDQISGGSDRGESAALQSARYAKIKAALRRQASPDSVSKYPEMGSAVNNWRVSPPALCRESREALRRVGPGYHSTDTVVQAGPEVVVTELPPILLDVAPAGGGVDRFAGLTPRAEPDPEAEEPEAEGPAPLRKKVTGEGN